MGMTAMLRICQGLSIKRRGFSLNEMQTDKFSRFGGSDDIVENTTSTKFYVDTLMGLYRYLKLPKMHLVGHHTGSAMAMEMGAIYPEEILTVTCSAPALATPEEQAVLRKAFAEEWSKPKEDGSQLMRV